MRQKQEEKGSSLPPLVADMRMSEHMASVNALSSLTPVEREVASLGIDPDALKPISFINTGYYAQLQKQQLISSEFAAKIGAYQSLASADAESK